LTVRVDEQLGLQAAEEKEPDAPVGSPDTEKETASVLPATSEALIALVTDDPATTDLFPVFAREKSKGWVTVNDALATVLELKPALTAIALIVALLDSVMAPE
jgi:hypothetical protein